MWRTEYSVDTTALPEAIWALFRDVEGWWSWNPGLRWAIVDGPFQTGTAGRMKPVKGPKRRFVITEMEEERSFATQAKLPGARLHFVHRIKPLGDGHSQVTMGAAIDGPISGGYSLILGRDLAGYLPIAVKQLAAKAEAESTTPS
jgi:hypothetical protein